MQHTVNLGRKCPSLLVSSEEDPSLRESNATHDYLINTLEDVLDILKLKPAYSCRGPKVSRTTEPMQRKSAWRTDLLPSKSMTQQRLKWTIGLHHGLGKGSQDGAILYSRPRTTTYILQSWATLPICTAFAKSSRGLGTTRSSAKRV